MFSPFGILGINARNLKYIKTSKRARLLMDSKLLTKNLLKKAGLPVLETLGVIASRKELQGFNFESLPPAFALKPNRGLGGQGILIVYGRKKGSTVPLWIKANNEKVTIENLRSHILDVLEGQFSLAFLPDIAFFEERAKIIKEFKPYSFKGIPDLRVIVYQRVPVMAMLRLPTKESQGRANLHQGAVGVGIDLARGITTNAIYHGKIIDYYPGTRYLLRGIKIPHFKKILELAVLVSKVLKADFLGVDINIDREKGPAIFEVNARPGLAIQMANLAGLEQRLKKVEGLKVLSEKRARRLAQDLFGEIEEEPEEIFGKKILGVVEPVELIVPKEGDLSEKRYKILAKIDTGAWRSVISFEIARKLNLNPQDISGIRLVRSSLGEEVRAIFPLTFILGGERIESGIFLADRSKMKYEMIVGRRDLKNFIVDPSRFNK